jgi:hypothetical protein
MLAVVRKGGGIGLATEYRSEKILQNTRLRMASVILRKKVLIPRFTEESRNGRKWHDKNPAPANRIDSMFLSETCFGTEFRAFASIFSHGTESREFFFFAERFGTEFREFSVPRNGSERDSESFLFHGTAGIPPEQTNCSVYSVFRGQIFLSEISNPIEGEERVGEVVIN